jgi:uncharacterized protein YjbI with pentapeptide repeats
MIPVILVFAVFLILILLSVFFWFWWVGPRDQVPPHLAEAELRRLEVQDRIRQTNYQVLAALGLGATFLTTLFQFLVASQHWSSEFESKAAQERTAQYIEAVKQIDQGTAPSSRKARAPATSDSSAASVAAVRTLYLLGTQYPDDYHHHAHTILSSFVLSKTLGKHVLEKSRECRNDFGLSGIAFGELLKQEEKDGVPQDREEALPSVQSAMIALGDVKFSKFRLHDDGKKCRSASAPGYKLKLEHAILDNLDLSGQDLSCSLMSQSKLRRVSLNRANLSYSDLRGARFADFDIPETPAAIGTIRDRLYHREGPPEWKRYRCWASDLRGANLSHAILEGAQLAGADLTDADLTGANLCRTDVSRVNFARTKGLTMEMLQDACAGKPESDERTYAEAQPTGHNFPAVQRCSQYKCSNEKEPSVDGKAPSFRQRMEPAIKQLRENIVADVAALGIVTLATGFFLWVGAFAKRHLSVSLPDSPVNFPSRFPERSLSYSREFFETFLRERQAAAAFYRKPILLPLDFLVMILFAGAMAFASWHWFSASGVQWPWLALILPSIYLLADFAEDVRLMAILENRTVSDHAIASLKRLTALKLFAVCAGISQTVIALVVYISTLALSGWTSLAEMLSVMGLSRLVE